MNRDPKVAEFLISQGLETTSSAEYNVLPSLGSVYPLFFARISKNNRIDLIHLLSNGLTQEQIETTKTQVATHQKWLDSLCVQALPL